MACHTIFKAQLFARLLPAEQRSSFTDSEQGYNNFLIFVLCFVFPFRPPPHRVVDDCRYYFIFIWISQFCIRTIRSSLVCRLLCLDNKARSYRDVKRAHVTDYVDETIKWLNALPE